ncbi:unnamed protein product [Rotaria sp. Silwood1]|nr:unnamed protein product [Rotaria sp. Silwood1]
MFLKEREQLFLLKTNQEQEKSASSLTSDNSPLLIIDENILADVKILACVDLDYCVKEKMDILSRKILSGNQFPTGNF